MASCRVELHCYLEILTWLSLPLHSQIQQDLVAACMTACGAPANTLVVLLPLETVKNPRQGLSISYTYLH